MRKEKVTNRREDQGSTVSVAEHVLTILLTINTHKHTVTNNVLNLLLLEHFLYPYIKGILSRTRLMFKFCPFLVRVSFSFLLPDRSAESPKPIYCVWNDGTSMSVCFWSLIHIIKFSILLCIRIIHHTTITITNQQLQPLRTRNIFENDSVRLVPVIHHEFARSGSMWVPKTDPKIHLQLPWR